MFVVATVPFQKEFASVHKYLLNLNHNLKAVRFLLFLILFRSTFSVILLSVLKKKLKSWQKSSFCQMPNAKCQMPNVSGSVPLGHMVGLSHPLWVEWSHVTNSGQWAVSRNGRCLFQARAFNGQSHILQSYSFPGSKVTHRARDGSCSISQSPCKILVSRTFCISALAALAWNLDDKLICVLLSHWDHRALKKVFNFKRVLRRN